MYLNRVNDYGELEIDFNNITGPGGIVTIDFLSKLSERFMERSSRYYEATKDHAFAYRERQVQSIICPAIADLTPSFLIENPLWRKPIGESEYRGAADYWVLYRDYSFLMEIKHNYFAFNMARNPRKSIAEKLSKATEQLKNIRHNECREQTYGKGLRRIALEVVTFYQSAKEETNLQKDMTFSDFSEIFKTLISTPELKNDWNFYSLWVLDKSLVKTYEYTNTNEIYPAVALLAKVFPIVD